MIELIVAMAVFSVMAVMGYNGLRNFLVARQTLEDQQAALTRLETAFLIVQQDIENAVKRPVRDGLGGPEPALRGGETAASLLALTRARTWVPETGMDSDLRRVEYFVKDHRIVRRSWPVLDRTQTTKPLDQVLFTDIDGLSFRFYDDRWRGFWPLGNDPETLASLPRAVGVRVVFRDGRAVERLFLLGNAG